MIETNFHNIDGSRKLSFIFLFYEFKFIIIYFLIRISSLKKYIKYSEFKKFSFMLHSLFSELYKY